MASSSPIPLPQGVVVDPTDEQLVSYYLMGKVYGFNNGKGFHFIKVIELYDCEPSMLSRSAPNTGHGKMFFFARLRKKNQDGRNVNRKTPGGFWRKTGPPSYITGKKGECATKTSLVYYEKDPTKSKTVKTQWLMKEYMLSESNIPDPWTLCVVYKSDRKS